MIPITIEATNASNIGAYKNTPNTKGIKPQYHDKPIPGSRSSWHRKSKLKESKLPDNFKLWKVSEEDFINHLIGTILQNPKYKAITFAVDNDHTDAGDVIENDYKLRDIIESKILPICYDYIDNNKEYNPMDVSPMLSLPEISDTLETLNSEFKSMYTEVTAIC